MAIFGNFVGKKDLELTNEEKEMFMNFFKMKLFNYHNCNFEKVLTIQNVKEECYTTFTDFKSYYFIFKPKESLNGRNIKRDRVIDFSGISFIIRKESGFLEVKNKEENINAPEFQYSLNILIQGKQIRYKCRNIESISLKNSFQFGTELSDFDFSNTFYDLYRTLYGLI